MRGAHPNNPSPFPLGLGFHAARFGNRQSSKNELWTEGKAMLVTCQIHDFHNGGHRESPGSSCMKTSSKRPNYRVASLFVCYGEYFEYFKIRHFLRKTI